MQIRHRVKCPPGRPHEQIVLVEPPDFHPARQLRQIVRLPLDLPPQVFELLVGQAVRIHTGRIVGSGVGGIVGRGICLGVNRRAHLQYWRLSFSSSNPVSSDLGIQHVSPSSHLRGGLRRSDVRAIEPQPNSSLRRVTQSRSRSNLRLIIEATIDCDWTEWTRDDAHVGVTRVVVDRVIAGPRETIGQWDGADTAKRDYSAFKLGAGDHLDVAGLDLYAISPDLAGGKRRAGWLKAIGSFSFLWTSVIEPCSPSCLAGDVGKLGATSFNALRLIVGTDTYAFVQHRRGRSSALRMSSTIETATPVLFPEVIPTTLDRT